MTYRALPCFKAYDVRGRIGIDLDGDVAYRVGRAVAQHFAAETVVVGYDARETSPEFAAEVARGVTDAGADVNWLGMAGTEEMYWAVLVTGGAVFIGSQTCLELLRAGQEVHVVDMLVHWSRRGTPERPAIE